MRRAPLLVLAAVPALVALGPGCNPDNTPPDTEFLTPLNDEYVERGSIRVAVVATDDGYHSGMAEVTFRANGSNIDTDYQSDAQQVFECEWDTREHEACVPIVLLARAMDEMGNVA